MAAAKQEHDDYITREGFLNTALETSRTWFNIKPFDPAVEATEEYKYNMAVYLEQCRFDGLGLDLHGRQAGRPDPLPLLSVTQEAARYKLCQAAAPARPLLHCTHLHYWQPLARLGPARLEVLSTEPFVGLFHAMFSGRETGRIVSAARGKLKPTPYLVGGKLQRYSGRRTSKLLYMSEASLPDLSAVTARLERATRFSLTGHRLDAENYQVMNYGVGGSIDVHRDSEGLAVAGSTEAPEMGGQRLTTVMIYLSDVEAGGRTVFTSAAVSVAPRAGSVLLWMNHRSDGSLDSRSFHTGCPVLVGSKWIANKASF